MMFFLSLLVFSKTQRQESRTQKPAGHPKKAIPRALAQHRLLRGNGQPGIFERAAR
jgi:hypothetical protein